MAIHCPNCGQSFRQKAELLGKRVRCPKCKERFTVPSRDELTPPLELESADVSEEEEGSQPIALDTSLLTMLKNPTRILPALVILLPLMQGDLSQTSMIFVSACLLVVLASLGWAVYSRRGSWIRFGTNEITFNKQGTEHTYSLADLVSIRCPTPSQRRFLDFVQLKFKSGPKLWFSSDSPRFEEAKDGLMNMLARSRSVQDCVVVGDFEFPRQVTAPEETTSKPQLHQADEAASTPFKTSDLAAREHRLLARVIDVAICYAVARLWAPFAMQMLGPIRPPGVLFIMLVLIVPVAITYVLLNGYLLATRGQSIGKWLVGIQIVDVQTNELLPIRRIIMQRVVPVVLAMATPAIGILLLLIDIAPIFREEQRCIHDMLAASKVVKCR